jgi:diguanylate cyclase (GGDEF)-like protein
VIGAISRFRVANGTQAAVGEAFAHRAGLVDRQPGFLGLEVYTDAKDVALFYLVTRWTDETAFEAWHHSAAHRESHRGIPRGVKLDKAQTKLFMMHRIPSGAGAGGLEPVIADAAPFVAEFVRGAASLIVVEASADGTVRACNPAAARLLGATEADPGGVPLWACMEEERAQQLRRRVARGERRPGERFQLKLRGAAQVFDCALDLRPGGFVLLGERAAGADVAMLGEMTRINNEVVEISRESARMGQALARAHGVLQEKNAALEAANARITELSRTDPMTGCFNRRYFDEVFATEIARARRNESPLCVLMADLDHFKSVNDRYGHGAGDTVLIAAAAALKACSRPYDIVARYGGEEFVLLLPQTRLEGAVGCAERLRAAVSALQVEGYPHRITASLGAAMLAAGEDADALVGRADAALYRAKEGGRNRVAADLPANG